MWAVKPVYPAGRSCNDRDAEMLNTIGFCKWIAHDLQSSAPISGLYPNGTKQPTIALGSPEAVHTSIMTGSVVVDVAPD